MLLLFLSVLLQPAPAQESSANPYGLALIADTAAYLQSIKENPAMKLVDLSTFIPGLVLDIRYATANNFTGKQVYTAPEAYARLPVAVALKEVQADLHRQGLSLKVFDAYRPYAATLLFYEIVKDTTFVAAPWHGSRHNRACAVDVSLVDLSSGQELEMPTPFDEFSPKAAPTYNELSKKQIINRGTLIRTMQKYGFSVYPDEWWHFDFSGWEKYPLMDLSFEQLKSLK